MEYKDCVDEISTCQSSYSCDKITSDDVTNLFFQKASFSSICHVTCCDRYGTCHQKTNERIEVTSTPATTLPKIVTQEMTAPNITTQNMASQHMTTQSMTTQNMASQYTTTKTMTTQNITTQDMTTQSITTQEMTTSSSLVDGKFVLSLCKLHLIKTFY